MRDDGPHDLIVNIDADAPPSWPQRCILCGEPCGESQSILHEDDWPGGGTWMQSVKHMGDAGVRVPAHDACMAKHCRGVMLPGIIAALLGIPAMIALAEATSRWLAALIVLPVIVVGVIVFGRFVPPRRAIQVTRVGRRFRIRFRERSVGRWFIEPARADRSGQSPAN